MNKAQRIHNLFSRLERAGFSTSEAATLRRIEMTLHKWSEHECNGNIQRDGENSDGKPRWYSVNDRTGAIYRGPVIADRERGALKRLAKLMASHPDYVHFVQGDPRGCQLYIVPKADLLPDVPLDSQYTRGIAVCE